MNDSSAGSTEIAIEAATRDDTALLSNLLELYIHDLSAVFGLDVGADGRFGYAKLPLYWSEPGRFPFLIRAGDRIAGFALVTRGSPATSDPDDFDVAEFFVLRRYRRSGVGRQAAMLLWGRMPGRWVVRVSEGNQPALPFWEGVIRAYSGDRFSSSTRPGRPHAWRVYAFESGATQMNTHDHR
jgi:predicted acetyltransferase